MAGASGYTLGDLRSEIETDKGRQMCPMTQASFTGELSVCKWLFKSEAAADIRKARNFGYTPMLWACRNGHLAVAQWLCLCGSSSAIFIVSMINFT